MASAKDIIRRATDIINDQTSVRWPVGELVRFLNDGQREVVMYRPDVLAKTTSVALVAGTLQSLPAEASRIMDVISNDVGTRRAVRLVGREILDAQTPGWHGLAGVQEVLHYVYDQRNPRVFWVYPPAAVGARLRMVYATLPVDVLEPGDGKTWADVAGSTSLPDTFSNVLLDYVLYRAYLKDSQYAGNVQRSQGHYAAFANALGVEMKMGVGFGPTSTGNPNAAAANAA